MRLVEQIAAILKAPTTIEMFGTGSSRNVCIGNVPIDVLLMKRIGQELLVETRMTSGKRKNQQSWDHRQHQSSTEHHTAAILTFAMETED